MALTKANNRMIDGAVFNVLDYGATADGVTDDRAACQSAITAAIAAGGGTVFFPAGDYLLNGASSDDSTLNGLLVPYSGSQYSQEKSIVLMGEGRATRLLAGSNDMYIIRFSDSNGGVSSMSISGNSKTGVYGLGAVPESVTQTTDLVFQSFNIFSNLYILDCENGFTIKAGPDVGGADSGAWYNLLENSHIFRCTRGIWLQDGTNASSSPANRNTFINVRCGQAPMNTGLQIDAADSCKFYAVNFEGISAGTSPNTTPTAIKIANVSLLSGAANNSNTFVGCTSEGCTRDLDNFNPLSEFYSCGMIGSKVNLSGGAGIGRTFIGGNGPSEVPEKFGNIIVQANGQFPGLPNGTTFYTQTGRTQLLLNGRLETTGSFQETNGSSGNIANAATFTVTIPTPRRPQLLFVYSNANLTNPGVYLLCGDGSGNIGISNIVSSGQVSLSATASNQVEITNASGVTANIRWTLTPFGLAAA